MGDPFHQVSIRDQGIDARVNQLMTGTIVERSRPLGGDSHPDSVREALPQWARGHLDARRIPIFGMTRRGALPLAEVLDLLHG